ncbi:MAG: hypothetical protein AVO34_06845 [Firmicutes bacterium ML8_F2]|nr:MAG: hypothetical protein AVO34_06845 [Firmicutes bacterium ML8_F2]
MIINNQDFSLYDGTNFLTKALIRKAPVLFFGPKRSGKTAIAAVIAKDLLIEHKIPTVVLPATSITNAGHLENEVDDASQHHYILMIDDAEAIDQLIIDLLLKQIAGVSVRILVIINQAEQSAYKAVIDKFKKARFILVEF